VEDPRGHFGVFALYASYLFLRRLAMSEKSLFRIGAASAFLGSALGVLANLIHPRADDPADTITLLREAVANPGLWIADHMAIMISGLLAVAGLVAISRSIRESPGKDWAQFGAAGAMIGGAILCLFIAIDSAAFLVAGQTLGHRVFRADAHFVWAGVASKQLVSQMVGSRGAYWRTGRNADRIHSILRWDHLSAVQCPLHKYFGYPDGLVVGGERDSVA
jgi:hypothetical protein